ncbi:solute symporter family transporter [Roridomyces roridus]|uniref:Solute symporter family transporter n=1 Tax=Roridomyces roridus TaxID=1738132 RepID=A0AAD7BYT0_9AGAR|nr:solute symporter family transporter [Roridomyces roridus]
MASSSSVILPVGVGYAVVVGIGFFFAGLMLEIPWLQNRYTSFSTQGSEEFNTASRSVKPGLIASGVVSAATWAATLLQSSTVTYQFGVAGAFWYAASATAQISLFAVLACKVKQNAPRCHTYLEIIYARYGKGTHLVFIFFALLNNVFVASQLLLGGSAVVNALTGMNVYAAIFLIPLGVCVYVVLGGLRATFLCDFSHTAILMIVMFYFIFSVYTTNPLIGSPSEMYRLLQAAALKRPVAGNRDGSYLTLDSHGAMVFGMIILHAGMATVCLDQAYWQRAIASRPTTAVRAYLLGGLAWFAIPFTFSTALGLAAVALADNPSFPTYPNPLSGVQITQGLASPFAVSALLGKSGAVALLIVLFMAVTSCASAELIAVSSILTFDVYKTYLVPNATSEQLIVVSHWMICVFGIAMAVFACIWNAIGIDLGWLFLVMGLTLGGAVFPAVFTVTWRGQSKEGAIMGALGGLAVGIAAWLGTAQALYGEITIASTGMQYSTLAGNVGALVTGLVITLVVSWIKPQDGFEWEVTRAINSCAMAQQGEKDAEEEEEEERQLAIDLKKAFSLACVGGGAIILVLAFIIPVSMICWRYIFSERFFTGWIVVSFVWAFLSTGVSTVWPVVEAWPFFKQLARAVVGDLRKV